MLARGEIRLKLNQLLLDNVSLLNQNSDYERLSIKMC